MTSNKLGGMADVVASSCNPAGGRAHPVMCMARIVCAPAACVEHAVCHLTAQLDIIARRDDPQRPQRLVDGLHMMDCSNIAPQWQLTYTRCLGPDLPVLGSLDDHTQSSEAGTVVVPKTMDLTVQ